MIVAVLTWTVLRFTPWGRSVYATGSGPTAAHFSGINTAGVLLSVYSAAGFLDGLTALVVTSRVATARADLGSIYLLQAITACALGGTDLTGGKGSVAGTLLAVAISFFKDVIQGTILILVLLIQSFFRRKDL